MKEYNNGNPNFDVANYSTWSRSSSGENIDWRAKAACLDVDDAELFFPVGSTGPAKRQIERAKAVCSTCDSRVDCLEFAFEHNLDHGVWGGLSENERRSLRSRGKKAVRLFLDGIKYLK